MLNLDPKSKAAAEMYAARLANLIVKYPTVLEDAVALLENPDPQRRAMLEVVAFTLLPSITPEVKGAIIALAGELAIDDLGDIPIDKRSDIAKRLFKG